MLAFNNFSSLRKVVLAHLILALNCCREEPIVEHVEKDAVSDNFLEDITRLDYDYSNHHAESSHAYRSDLAQVLLDRIIYFSGNSELRGLESRFADLVDQFRLLARADQQAGINATNLTLIDSSASERVAQVRQIWSENTAYAARIEAIVASSGVLSCEDVPSLFEKWSK